MNNNNNNNSHNSFHILLYSYPPSALHSQANLRRKMSSSSPYPLQDYDESAFQATDIISNEPVIHESDTLTYFRFCHEW